MKNNDPMIDLWGRFRILRQKLEPEQFEKLIEHVTHIAPIRYAKGREGPLKIYLAGPQVFRKDAIEHAQWQREICTKYDLIGIHPMDNNIDFSDLTYKTAEIIYRGDCRQILQCDITVADCNSFRGALIDDGTAYELGASNVGFWMPTYGYIEKLALGTELIPLRFPCKEELWKGMRVDADDYLLVDDFETSINLMMQCGMTDSGGRLVEGNFEDCIRAVREDLDTGKLNI